MARGLSWRVGRTPLRLARRPLTVAIPPGLLRAYRLTKYRAAGTETRIGRPAPDALLAQLSSDRAVFVTAWNPLSRRMPEGWNRRAQLRLQRHLRRFGTLDAHGSLGRWREAHLVVAGDPRAVIRLARRFRQSAVVVLQRGRSARLVLLRV